MINSREIEKAFKTYYPSLLMFATKWMKDNNEAKDIIQSVFTHLLEKSKELKINDYRAYLFKSVRNKCINSLKKSAGKSDELKESDIKDFGYFNDPIEEAEFEAYIFQLIDKLPLATKKIFKLNRFEGLTNQEIAEKLNISKRTVELQISNALKKLREIIFDPKNPKSNYSQFIFLVL